MKTKIITLLSLLSFILIPTSATAAESADLSGEWDAVFI